MGYSPGCRSGALIQVTAHPIKHSSSVGRRTQAVSCEHKHTLSRGDGKVWTWSTCLPCHQSVVSTFRLCTNILADVSQQVIGPEVAGSKDRKARSQVSYMSGWSVTSRAVKDNSVLCKCESSFQTISSTPQKQYLCYNHLYQWKLPLERKCQHYFQTQNILTLF